MILDASALLALLNDETGADEVQRALGDAVMSSVNLAEVFGKLSDAGMPDAAIHQATSLGITVLAFGEGEASLISKVRKATKPLGLSLGDRCCLVTALAHKHSVLTADRAWAKVKIRGLTIKLLDARK